MQDTIIKTKYNSNLKHRKPSLFLSKSKFQNIAKHGGPDGVGKKLSEQVRITDVINEYGVKSAEKKEPNDLPIIINSFTNRQEEKDNGNDAGDTFLSAIWPSI